MNYHKCNLPFHILSLTLIFSCCTSMAQDKGTLQKGQKTVEVEPYVEFDAGYSSLNIPLEVDQSGKIYFRGQINNGKQLRILLDTGVATRLVLDRRVAEASNLKLVEGYQIQGTGRDRTHAALANDFSLRLPGLTFHHISAHVFPFYKADPGKESDAILGFYLFKDLIVEINPATKSMNIHAPHVYRYERSGELIPIQVINDLIYLKAKIKFQKRPPIEALLNLDTGSGTTLLLFDKLVREHRLTEYLSPQMRGVTVGHGGEVQAVFGNCESLEIGKQARYSSPFTGLHLEPSGSLTEAVAAGSIGAQFFSRFKVIYDIPQNRIFLETIQ